MAATVGAMDEMIGLGCRHAAQLAHRGERQGPLSKRVGEFGKRAERPSDPRQVDDRDVGAAGFDVEVSACIQRDIWYKLWGNMTMNPVSALTGATLDRILDDELVNGFCLAVMREAAAIGAKIGCPIAESGEDRNAVTRRLGAVKTSMLQDVESHRPVEIDVLLSAVREIGERVQVATPALDALLGLARLHARGQGLYPA